MELFGDSAMDENDSSVRSSPSAKAVGRPRDDTLDERITQAAIDIYAEKGWGKFTFDAVASRAHVGKSAIYLRFGSREELLVAALESSYDPVFVIDTGSSREDLRDFVRSQFHFWLSTLGNATLRVSVDQIYMHDLGDLYRRRVVKPFIDSARQIVVRGKERGEIDSLVDTDLLLEALSGAVRTRVTDTRPVSRSRLPRIIDQYAEDLVDLIFPTLPAHPPRSRS